MTMYLLKVTNKNTRKRRSIFSFFNSKDIRTTSMASFWYLCCWLFTAFTTFSSVWQLFLVFEFEQVHVPWVLFYLIVDWLYFFIFGKRLRGVQSRFIKAYAWRYNVRDLLHHTLYHCRKVILNRRFWFILRSLEA